MKKVIMLICFTGVSLFYVQSGNVPVKGKLLVGDTMKNPSSPVEVFQNSTGIELSFLCDLGDLCIEVTDESGAAVFQTVVKASAGSSLPIDTSSWDTGEYTLVITDKLGGCLEGYFVID